MCLVGIFVAQLSNCVVAMPLRHLYAEFDNWEQRLTSYDIHFIRMSSPC